MRDAVDSGDICSAAEPTKLPWELRVSADYIILHHRRLLGTGIHTYHK